MCVKARKYCISSLYYRRKIKKYTVLVKCEIYAFIEFKLNVSRANLVLYILEINRTLFSLTILMLKIK